MEGGRETTEIRNPQVIVPRISQGNTSTTSEGNIAQQPLVESSPQGESPPNQRQQGQQQDPVVACSDDTPAANAANKSRDASSATVHTDAAPAVEGEGATVHTDAASVVERRGGGGDGVESRGREHPPFFPSSLPRASREQGSSFEPWLHEEAASRMGSPSSQLASPSGLERTDYIDGRLGVLSPGTYSADNELFEEEHEGASSQKDIVFAERGKAIGQAAREKRDVGDEFSAEAFVPSERSLFAYCQVTAKTILVSWIR